MLNFNNDATKFYIVAPANLATGGPELLHQLAYKLKQNGKNVSMFYIPTNHTSPVHDNYKQYGIDYVRQVNDDEKNVVIMPETQTQLLNEYSKTKKIVWWLSVDNYFLWLPGIKGRLNRLLLNRVGSQKYFFFNSTLMKSADFHLVQSEYAKEYLNKRGINKVGYLADYLHESFLKVETSLDFKEDIVAYNPKKGIKFTKSLIKKAPEIKFVAIENMTREEVVALLQKSKVYIDFGFHPGKDRIPREAAFLKCCVITNKRGSARFSKDVPIEKEFKFDENESNLNFIKDKINDCFKNYSQNIEKFEKYRQEIKQQESEFDDQVREFFK
ncbi:MAG: hypothetical protein IE909_12665 [Campylobacterales bacterium]|nr:hypothetical protein [Campylobacterales bacterium]